MLRTAVLIGYIFLTSFLLCAQQNDLEYYRSIFSEPDIKGYIENTYTQKSNNPFSESEFDAIRSKVVGKSFYEPKFGRKWTFIYDGGHNIMNSERNAWNSDGSLFFLPVGSGTGFVKVALFDGSTSELINHITVSGLPSSSTALRWLPGDNETVFYFEGNKIKTYNLISGQREDYQQFASFSLSEKDVGGGDGNEVSPDGDLLISNKGKNAFVYNFSEKKVVRMQDGNRVYFEPDSPFPTFDLGSIDYTCVFGGFIFEVDEDGSGLVIRDLNGTKIQSLYKRTPHMDPTFFLSNDKLYPGTFIRYNAADASYYSSQGLPSKTGKAYFHGFDPENPSQLVRFPMDDWNATVLGSGGQISANQIHGGTGILSIHGPAKYDLGWEPRFGECYESAYYSGESEMPRRFAHHYIGFESVYTSSGQPEGWLSPDGSFAIIKTKWGWYRVDLAVRLLSSEVDAYLTSPMPTTYSLTVQSGSGGGLCVEDAKKIVEANPPKANFVFDSWTGDIEYLDDPASAITVVNMPAKAISIEATYREKEKYALNLTISGNGTVTINPSGTEFYSGTQVALIATPDSGYSFLRWEKDISSSNNPAIVLVDETKDIHAVFSDYMTDISGKFGENWEEPLVYPNPVSDHCFIDLSHLGNTRVYINLLNQSGKVLLSYSNLETSEGLNRLKLPDQLPQGFYILQIRSGPDLFHRKIVVAN